jgi:hypothetical protein
VTAVARVACFTSFTYAYLARARVLAQSVRRMHPDWTIWAVVTDRAPDNLPSDALASFDAVIDARDLPIPGFRGWIFRHDVVEACTAVKGAMLCHLLAEGAEKVIYLDPDIAVFAPLDPVLERLEAASIVLTPHQTEPNEAGLAVRDNERGSMRYGIFNLGFLGVRNDATGRAFAAWWAERLGEACFDAPEQGLFTDQKYCDLVPGLFAGVHIERDPGYNVASWNVNRRPLAFNRHGELTAAGRLLRFYHFTKIDGPGAVMTERYAGDNVEVHELVGWYRRALADAAIPAAQLHPWHYGAFSDGTAIPRAARLLLRDRRDIAAAFPDPFDASGYAAWLRRERPAVFGA